MTVTEASEKDEKRLVKSGADRRPRGWLETDVKHITDDFVTGNIKLEDGEFLTPHRVSKLVQKFDCLDEAPSTGAVAAVFERWIELGFMVANEKPFAFLDYTEEGRAQGLTAMKAARRSAKAEARKADPNAKKPGRPKKVQPEGTEVSRSDNPETSS